MLFLFEYKFVCYSKFKTGYPGILNHLETDAKTFADWGVDYVKLDGCYADPSEMDKGVSIQNWKYGLKTVFINLFFCCIQDTPNSVLC